MYRIRNRFTGYNVAEFHTYDEAVEFIEDCKWYGIGTGGFVIVWDRNWKGEYA